MENIIINAEEILKSENQISEIKKEILSEKSEKGKKIISDAKKKDASKKEIIIKDEKSGNLEKINFGKFAKEMEGINIHIAKDRELLYIYPMDIFKNDKFLINSSIGKNWRSKRRKDLENLCNWIFQNYKMKDEKGLRDAIASFDKNYKIYYRNNNYSLSSLSSSNDASKGKNIQFALDIIKEIKGMNKKK